MTEKPLIGLLGAKGAGKSTVAAILAEDLGYRVGAWADALRREIFDAFGRMILIAHDPGLAPTFEDWVRFVDAHKYDDPASPFGYIRPLLQFWGTQYRRERCGADYWVGKLTLGPGLVVADCRFWNELEAIRRAGGLLWRILRPGYGGDAHASERATDGAPADATIRNDGTLDDLRASVRAEFCRLV